MTPATNMLIEMTIRFVRCASCGAAVHLDYQVEALWWLCGCHTPGCHGPITGAAIPHIAVRDYREQLEIRW